MDSDYLGPLSFLCLQHGICTVWWGSGKKNSSFFFFVFYGSWVLCKRNYAKSPLEISFALKFLAAVEKTVRHQLPWNEVPRVTYQCLLWSTEWEEQPMQRYVEMALLSVLQAGLLLLVHQHSCWTLQLKCRATQNRHLSISRDHLLLLCLIFITWWILR